MSMWIAICNLMYFCKVMFYGFMLWELIMIINTISQTEYKSA